MRPQDIAVLIKIVSMGDQPWQLSTLSNELSISISEISESLNRSRIAKLIDYEKKKINRQNLMEFLEHGIKYVFSVQRCIIFSISIKFESFMMLFSFRDLRNEKYALIFTG